SSVYPRFTIINTSVYKNNTDTDKIKSTLLNILILINKAAELCDKYLSKGDKIYVEGKIRTRHWQTEEGITKHTTEIQVTEFIFLQTKKDLDAKTKNLKHSVDDKLSNFEIPKISDYDNLNELPF